MIEVPRDRNGKFEPQLVIKNQRRFEGLEEKIISLYARGMTQREIKGHLEEIYGDCGVCGGGIIVYSATSFPAE